MVDVLIRGAHVVDGTGRTPVQADVAIAGDRIAAVGDLGGPPAGRVIEGRGFILAPGFVDVHSHSDYFLLVNPRAESAVRQGVTTEIGGNCGYAAAPVFGAWREERVAHYREVYGLDHPWSHVGEYFAHLKGERPAINFGLLIGHNTIRGSVMGGADRQATAEELAALATAVRRGMDEGALGLSTGLIYPPACFAPGAELTALATVAREAGGVLTCHMRSEGDRLLEAIDEIIGVVRAAAIPLQISHLKTSGPGNWAKLPEAIERIERARSAGQDVTADRYPYTASNTELQAILPNWARAGSRGERLARLQDAAARARLIEELQERRWDQIMIAEVTEKRHKRYEGLRVSQAAALAGQPPPAFVLDLLAAEQCRVDAILFTMSETNLQEILRHPYVMIASDSGTRTHAGPLARGRPHPRTFGT
ncbi:MAG: amidohydrolase family protein, partial [Candidatus Methylomirabilales bacterium]